MIKIENVVLASPEQMMFIIEGMRNPLNSHNSSINQKKRIKKYLFITFAGKEKKEWNRRKHR